jgi:hypothetical protein
MGRVLFNTSRNINLALKSSSGLLIGPYYIKNYCSYFLNIDINYWLMIRMFHIIFVYLLVLFVDNRTSKMVYWLNPLFEATNGLMITIVKNIDIINQIMLHVMKTFLNLQLKLCGVGKITYFFL